MLIAPLAVLASYIYRAIKELKQTVKGCSPLSSPFSSILSLRGQQVRMECS